MPDTAKTRCFGWQPVSNGRRQDSRICCMRVRRCEDHLFTDRLQAKEQAVSTVELTQLLARSRASAARRSSVEKGLAVLMPSRPWTERVQLGGVVVVYRRMAHQRRRCSHTAWQPWREKLFLASLSAFDPRPTPVSRHGEAETGDVTAMLPPGLTCGSAL